MVAWALFLFSCHTEEGAEHGNGTEEFVRSELRLDAESAASG